HCTAHGKALLAGMRREELARIFGSESLPAYTRQTITTVTQLAKVCAGIEKHGYASDEAEFREGLRCIAAPIRAQKGMIIGSIGLAGPVDGFARKRFPECVRQVVSVAAEISSRLGAESFER